MTGTSRSQVYINSGEQDVKVICACGLLGEPVKYRGLAPDRKFCNAKNRSFLKSLSSAGAAESKCEQLEQGVQCY